MTHKILAFGYQSRVGKDSCCEAICRSGLVREFQLSDYAKAAFADRLKSVSYDLFCAHGLRQAQFYERGEPGAKLRDVPLETIGKTPVEIWIEVGQKMREVYPAVWVEAALAWRRSSVLLVITDLRFPNEAAAVKQLGGWCVNVKRPGNPVKGSDRFLDDDYPWDATIHNTGSLEDLEAQAIQMARGYLRASAAEPCA